MPEHTFVSSAPRNPLFDRLKEPATGVAHEWPTWTIRGMARPWKFGTVLRRTRQNLLAVSHPELAGMQRLLVLVDDGQASFTAIRVDPMAPFTQAVANNWDSNAWEPDEK